MTRELKACPAGHSDVRVIGGPGTRGGPKYWAGCDHCSWRAWGDTQDEAIAAWNTRSSLPNPEGMTEAQIDAGAAALFSVSDFEGKYDALTDMSKQIYREKAYAVLRAALASTRVAPDRRFAQPCNDHEYITPGCPDCGRME